MKVTIEMTPEEYQQLQAMKDKPLPTKPHWYGGWWGIFPPNDADGITATGAKLQNDICLKVAESYR